ncbi:hypothetical protein AMR41_18220 [Hapalosiphon sp. MRB220]|nr:hypothetical protein AMR41_18220 [Hapalosiphon sp. MRB220]
MYTAYFDRTYASVTKNKNFCTEKEAIANGWRKVKYRDRESNCKLIDEIVSYRAIAVELVFNT